LRAIPDGGTMSVTLTSGTQVCLIRRGDQVSALHDECTHQGMSLSAGEVLPDGTIECPWHGARFDCVTGEVRRGPAEDDVKTFTVLVEGDSVLVAERDDR
jgi:3-phenylpropionate/trans-cinnamate dioxygenase ferredoxin subunit